jgi:hypothetical protein
MFQLAAFQSDLRFQRFCAIGDTSSANQQVVCVQNGAIETDTPSSLQNPKLLSITSVQSCVADAFNLNCWGSTYGGTPRPSNVANPTRLILSQEHACMLDDYGLLCWGELAKYQLEVPSELSAPGAVLDVAVGANRTCAVLQDKTVRCWGVKTVDDEDPPNLTGVTSITGSRQHVFCANNASGAHCWGGYTDFPR